MSSVRQRTPFSWAALGNSDHAIPLAEGSVTCVTERKCWDSYRGGCVLVRLLRAPLCQGDGLTLRQRGPELCEGAFGKPSQEDGYSLSLRPS